MMASSLRVLSVLRTWRPKKSDCLGDGWDLVPTARMASVNMSDWLQFQEFMRFKQLSQMSQQTRAAAPSAPLSAQAPTYRPAPVTWVNKINYQKAMESLLSKISANRRGSQHFGLWCHFRNLYTEFPDRFTLTAEPHGSAGDTYISFRYTEPNGSYVTFHAYGVIDTTLFVFSRVDIGMGGQIYKSAWVAKENDDGSTQSE